VARIQDQGIQGVFHPNNVIPPDKNFVVTAFSKAHGVPAVLITGFDTKFRSYDPIQQKGGLFVELKICRNANPASFSLVEKCDPPRGSQELVEKVIPPLLAVVVCCVSMCSTDTKFSTSPALSTAVPTYIVKLNLIPTKPNTNIQVQL
jgi:hypothetical protein